MLTVRGNEQERGHTDASAQNAEYQDGFVADPVSDESWNYTSIDDMMKGLITLYISISPRMGENANVMKGTNPVMMLMSEKERPRSHICKVKKGKAMHMAGKSK